MRTAAILVAAGVAGVAHGQSFTWIATPKGPTDVMAGEPITWTLSALMTAAEGEVVVGIAASIFDVLSSVNGEKGEITSWTKLNGLDKLVGDHETTDGYQLFGVWVHQLTDFGPFTDANPVDVLEFTWVSNDPGAFNVVYTTSTIDAVVWVGEPGGAPMDAHAIHPPVTEATMHWTLNVASPGGMGVFVGALWFGLRRRR